MRNGAIVDLQLKETQPAIWTITTQQKEEETQKKGEEEEEEDEDEEEEEEEAEEEGNAKEGWTILSTPDGEMSTGSWYNSFGLIDDPHEEIRTAIEL